MTWFQYSYPNGLDSKFSNFEQKKHFNALNSLEGIDEFKSNSLKDH